MRQNCTCPSAEIKIPECIPTSSVKKDTPDKANVAFIYYFILKRSNRKKCSTFLWLIVSVDL